MKLPGKSNPGLTLEDLPPAPAGKTGWPWTEAPPPLSGRDSEWPKISVITPSFNQGEFLEQTIRSILLQGYPHIEHIIIDGGSTDGSLAVIRKYERWLAFWCSEKDRGHTHGLNKGFAQATGQILCWLNSDDYFLPGALLTVGQTLAEGCGRYAMIGHCYRVRGDGTLPFLLKGRYHNRRRLLQVWKSYHMHQPAIFWRREVFEKTGWLDESLPLTVDYDYWARIARHFDFVNVDRALACANHHSAMKNHDDHVSYHRELKKHIRRYWPSLCSPERWWLEFSMFRSVFRNKPKPAGTARPTAISMEEFFQHIQTQLQTKPALCGKGERKPVWTTPESLLKKALGLPESVALPTEPFPVLRQKIISRIFDEVQSEVFAVLKTGWSVNRSETNFIETPWAFFEFAHEDWDDLYTVRLESQGEFGLIVLGLWHNKDFGVRRNTRLTHDLKRLGWGKNDGGPWWDGNSPLPKPFSDWAAASGFAVMVMQQTKLKSLLIEEIVKLCRHFKTVLAQLAKAADPAR